MSAIEKWKSLPRNLNGVPVTIGSNDPLVAKVIDELIALTEELANERSDDA